MTYSKFDVEIEATNFCNTRCLHCPHEAISRPIGKMNWDTYQILIDKLLSYISIKNYNLTIDFAGMGEPLLNPLIFSFVKYVSDKADTAITTNGSALTSKNIEKLIEAGLKLLIISYNGENQSTYELMMGGLSFKKAEHHLRNAINMTKGTQISIAINITLTKQTQNSLKAMINYFHGLGIENVLFSKCHNRGGKLNNSNVCDTPMPKFFKKPRCDIFEETLFVAWNGDILSCCHDLDGDNKLGNISINTIEEIIETKENILKNGINFNICKNCNDLYRFRKDQDKGIILKDWLYDLYTTDYTNQFDDELLNWIYEIYNLENKNQYFIQRLWNMNLDLTKQLNLTKEEIVKLQLQNQTLNNHLEIIRNNKIYRLIDKIIKFFYVRRF